MYSPTENQQVQEVIDLMSRAREVSETDEEFFEASMRAFNEFIDNNNEFHKKPLFWVEHALKLAWSAADRYCSRVGTFLVPVTERFIELHDIDNAGSSTSEFLRHVHVCSRACAKCCTRVYESDIIMKWSGALFQHTPTRLCPIAISRSKFPNYTYSAIKNLIRLPRRVLDNDGNSVMDEERERIAAVLDVLRSRMWCFGDYTILEMVMVWVYG